MASGGPPGFPPLPSEPVPPGEWRGPRLRSVMELAQSEPMKGSKSDISLSSYRAAVGDAQDFKRQGKYHLAASSYEFAIAVAKKAPVIQDHALVEVMHECASCQLQLQKYQRAGTLATECIDIQADFVKGYLMLGKALAAGGEVETAACSLLDGMQQCQLNSDEWGEFIVEASQLLASLKHRIMCETPNSALRHILDLNPCLPSSGQVWGTVVRQLFQKKAFKALAFLITGLPVEPVDFRFTSLETGCQLYDWHDFDVEELYAVLSSSDLKDWGNTLISTMVRYGAQIGRASSDPEAIKIARLALKYKTTDLLAARLHESGGCDEIDVDTPDFHGDTALHVATKSYPLSRINEEIIILLLSHGALPNVRDKHGKMPHEYLEKLSPAWNCFQAVLENPEEKFEDRIKRMKKQGNSFHHDRNHSAALEQYEKAVALIQRSPYNTKMSRDLAVLYSNMATVYSAMNANDMSFNMAKKSVQEDSSYHKPYWRLGKSLLEKNHIMEACSNFLLGTACVDADADQKTTFLVEICTVLSSLTETQIEMILNKMQPYLSICWPKMVENLSKNSQWDPMRRLVLGPPEILIEKSAVHPGWRFADRFRDGKQLKVGYAMCQQANTHVLSTLVEVVENQKINGINNWATDLVLALLLQGAPLGTLVTGEEETCYHVALNLCCLTEKLGLLRYLLSDDIVTREARAAVNKERRTLLHVACLNFGDGVHEVGKQLVTLLMEKGFDPMLRDMLEKKPEDYLAPRSPMSRLLTQSPADMKERGNSEFKRGRYREAIDCYSQAIDILSSKLPPLNTVQSMVGYEAEKHELAVLFSNRAECQLKLGNVDEAFTDAKDSVAWDGHWYRGHLRVGRALVRRGKLQQAIKAFSNAFNALSGDATEAQKKEVLKELMKTQMTVSEEPPVRIPHLGYVAPELWVKIAYDHFSEGNAQAEMGSGDWNANWRAGQYAYRLFDKSFKMPMTPPKIQVNLKPLCTWRLQPGTEFLSSVCDMIVFFLICGSDHTTLSFYLGDTYMHAATFLTIMEMATTGVPRILDWLVNNVARPRGEQNLQDMNGNTAVHLMVLDSHDHIPPLNGDLRCDIVEHLLMCGLNPRVRNNAGKMPVECLSPSSSQRLRSILEVAMRKTPEPAKEAPSSKKPITPQTSKPENETKSRSSSNADQQKPSPKEAAPKPATNVPGSDRSQKNTQQSARGSGAKRMDYQRLQCALCEEYLADARTFFAAHEKMKVGYSKLVSILNYTHQRDSRHAQFVRDAIELIVQQLSKSLTPDVPDVLLRVPQPHLQQILDKLAAADKWRQLEVVVDKARANDVPRGQFAQNFSLLALVKDKGLCGAEAQRIQILNMLVLHGAQLSPGTQCREAMTVALQHAEFRLAERLIEIGAEPKYLTLEEGDTPLHAALTIALDRDKGNFSLFEALLSWYEKDPQKHVVLNPSSVDKAGNTLLHVAMQARYSKHSHKAVEMLMTYDIPVDTKNHDGKMAIDYLTNRTDRRAQYLRVAGKQSMTSKKQKNEEEKPPPKLPAPDTEQNDSGNHQQEEIQNEEELEAPVKPKVDQPSRSDRRDLKVKDAVEILNSLVVDLPDLTAAEAKIARAAKGKWLEMEKPEVDESRYRPGSTTKRIIIGEPEQEVVVTPTLAGDAPVAALEDEDDEEEEEEDDKLEEGEELDLQAFDNLEWEVECTAEVWKTLRDKRVPFELKQRAVKRIQLLASGEWRPYLCRKVRRAPSTLNLYQAKLSRGARILWELAVAFSPRLSEAAEKRIDEDERKEEFAVRGGRVYTEIIRVWDIVFDNSRLRESINRIIQSHSRGEHCLIQKHLKGVKSQQFQGGLTKRYPMLFSEADIGTDARAAMEERERNRLKLYPPASASEMEFHILKFYCFSSALVYNVLKNIEMKIDFPFRVTDREHAVINLKSGAPILLLGRSGTGKTTCCLYRLWSRFLTYWTKSREMDGAPWLPRTIQYVTCDDAEEDQAEEDPNAELFTGLDEDNSRSAHASSASGECAEAKATVSSTAEEKKTGRAKSSSPDGWEEEGGEEEAADEEDEDNNEGDQTHVHYDHLHQLFVTKNQVLNSEVQKNFRELCHADDIASQHVAVEETPMPHRLQDITEYKYPLFLTSRQLILMLDASLPPPHFFERNEDGSLRVMIQGWGADEEIFAFVPLEDDSDEEEEEEEYYDDDGDEQGEGGDQMAEEAAADHRPKKKDNRREVTYEIFAHEIWPRIIKKAQVNYHPSLVWTEIMSFIKGSFGSLLQRNGYLNKDDYEKLGRKQAPNFTGNRDKVYELFWRYNDYKRQHGLYDEADLVFNIYQRLKIAGPLPWVLHEVFVDETQDFTQAELTVLIRLAHNPNDMFLTGDTAQSIMRGVSFRFSDLKTLFHYAKQSLKARGKTGMLEVPKQVYQLTHNYRSHAGILSLASAVLDLLVEFFPESFDRLEKDQGLFDGPQPVVLESGSPADLAILLSGNKRKTSHIEFGAHQVILVVSEEARNSLPEELSLGLVLTIYEAKGLEFDDVLLYNFFKDSQASKEWRVVTAYLERLSKNEIAPSTSSSGLVEIDEDVLQQTGRPRPLSFDPNQHKILNSELKHLYTALTRARVNVWIFDQHEEKRAPMFEYFKARKLVKFVSMSDGVNEDGVAQSMFAEKSSPEEWVKRGDEIMARSLYDVAAKCYAMGGDVRKQKIAVAHQRALEASHLRSQPRQMREAFLKAAILFLECHAELPGRPSSLACRYNLVMKAGRCLQNARENYLAAQVFEKNSQPEVAGPMYLRARKWLEASLCFEHVDNFNRALRILDEQELYDQAIDCLQRYKIRKQDFDKKGLPLPKALAEYKPEASYTVANLSYKAAMFYHRYKQTERMLAAIERLPNKDEQIKFLQNHGYLLHAARLMCSESRTTEAAHMMLYHGEVDRALLIAEEGADSKLKAQCYWLKAQLLLTIGARKKKAASLQKRKEDGESETAPEAQDVTAGKPEVKPRQGMQHKADSKKGKEDSASSDEDGGEQMEDDTQKQVTELLEKARQQFDLCKDPSGVGECQLMLSQLQLNKDLLEQAFDSFGTPQPVPNVAGMLECTEVLHKIAAAVSMDLLSCRRLIRGIEMVFETVHILLNPKSAEAQTKYQVYLQFYGLEKAEEGRLALHPKLKPRCIRMIGKGNLFANKEEKKKERLEKPAGLVCNHLSRFLIERTRDWCEEATIFMSNHLPKVIQCLSFQEGHKCEDQNYCPYVHEPYNDSNTRDAVYVLSCRVRLDCALQSGAESLKKIDENLSQMARSMSQEEHSWNSVETFLEFLFPAGLPTYHMFEVVSCIMHIRRKEQLFAGVHKQVERYLMHLWNNPGRVGRGRSDNVLKERCKSTDWIVLASLLSPILLLDINVDKMCEELELQLVEKRPDWVHKRLKYALLKDEDTVITLARRHLDALYFLKPEKFDPFESLIKFTKFVKLLSDRGEVALMPDLRIFFFWIEVFATLSLCLAAKMRGNGNLVLPTCYPRLLRLLNLILPNPESREFQRRLENFKPNRRQDLHLLQQRIEVLVGILCGWRQGHFSLLQHLVCLRKKKSTMYLLIERVLILALTLLVNVEHGNLRDIAEVPVLRAIHQIDPDMVEQMPLRLATMIRSVQAASSYSDILAALSAVLSGMQEKLFLYQWRWNPVEKEGLHPNNAAARRFGRQFMFFKPSVHLASLRSQEEVSTGEAEEPMDDIEEGGNVDEEEGLSEEEKVRYQQQLVKAQRAEEEKRAVGRIIKFLRWIIFNKHLTRLRDNYFLQEEKERFSAFIVTDKMCGICGVSFEKLPVDTTDTLDSPEGEEEKLVEEEQNVEMKLIQEHLASDEHRCMMTNYQSFRGLYRSMIIAPFLEIGAFLSRCQVKKLQKTVYKHLPYQTAGILQLYQDLVQALNATVQGRKWTDREMVLQRRHMLVNFFQQNVRGVVWKCFREYEDQQRQSSASRDAERQHQEKLMEDLSEDPNMSEILDVVDRPVPQGPQYAAGGGGLMGGVYRRGGGRGHRGRGGRGTGGRPRGGNEEFGQFAKGDLPPRFRRN